MTPWLNRRDAQFPFQIWLPFPQNAIVQVKNAYGDSRIAIVKEMWWGYEKDNEEGVIVAARRIDKLKEEYAVR